MFFFCNKAVLVEENSVCAAVLTADANAPLGDCSEWLTEFENDWRAQARVPCFRNWPVSSSFASRVAVVSKSFEGQTDKTEEWYGTQYRREDISNATVEVLSRGSPLLSNGTNTAETPKHAALLVSEMGRCRPQRQVQVTHEERVHSHQLWDLPSWERVSVNPHNNQGECCPDNMAVHLCTFPDWFAVCLF